MKKNSLFTQITVFFLIGLTLTGVLAGVVLKRIADKNVLQEKDVLSSGITADVEDSIKEYRSYEWVLGYLLEHYEDALDLEYDSSEKTEVKEAEFLKRHPGLTPTGATAEELERLSAEDQKTYAEIVYNHWMRRMNDMKRDYNASFLYIVATDDHYEEGMFLLTASDGTRERGTGFDNAYILGKVVPVTPDQAETFRNLTTRNDHFVYTPDYADRYRYLFRIGDMNVITGMTFEIASLRTDAENQLLQYISYFVLLQLLLSASYLICIYFFAFKPLKKVKMNVQEYAETKNSEKVREQLKEIRYKNEIGDLAVGVAEMTQEIDSYLVEIQEITTEKERIGAELSIATQIQADMLPRIFPAFPERSEFDLYASMAPAKEVGGDFYDFFLVDDDHLALVMADVSGKGVPAALFMVIAKTLIKNRAQLGESPAEILKHVNEQLCEGNEAQLFVTVWLAIIEISTGKGVAANAGHEHPVIRRKDGPYELVVYRHSPVVAAFNGISFREHPFELHPGDRLFVYTDGVTEATNENGELFGTGRMLEALNAAPEASTRELLENVRQSIDSFVGTAPQFDDITMLCCLYRGPEGPEATEDSAGK